jgi:TonB family protein
MMTVGAALALGGGAGAQEVSRPAPVGSPAEWITPDDYPPSALRIGAEGRVVAVLDIDRAGKVTSCAVQTSSGNAALDAATCAAMTTRGAFTPAKDANGKPVASSYVIPVSWALPKGAATSPIELTAATRLDLEVAVELALDGEGKVLTCRVLTAIAPSFVTAPGDACASFRPGTQAGPPLRRNGKPVASTVIQRMTRKVVTAP